MFCNTIECCNVAHCDLEAKSCIAGYYANTKDTGSGDTHLVKQTGVWKKSSKLFIARDNDNYNATYYT